MGLEEVGRGRMRAIAVALVLVATLLPVGLSVVLARQQARADQARRAEFFAADVLRRSEAIGDQAAAAFARMATAPAGDDCSPATQDILQEIDATSSYIQMVGFVRGDALVCSSYGRHAPAVGLGEVDYVSSNGADIRQNVVLPFAPGQRFIVIGRGGFVALIHKVLPVDSTVGDSGVTLAVVTGSRPLPFAARGQIDPDWIPSPGELAAGARRTVVIDDQVVAQMRSARFDFVAIAALDASDYSGTLARFAMLLVPIGLLLGLGLAWALLRIAKAQLSLPAAIRAGLRNDEFFIVLQPIVALADRRWVGAEVLLRWKRADGRFVRPDLFIPVAEETGTIRAITERVLEKSAPVLAELAKADGAPFLSINLSPQDLMAEETLPRLQRLLESSGARPEQVHVEVTERGFADTAAARDMVRRLRALGVRVSIDDFGTGYSSLSELVSFELDTLKIDKAFVDTIGSEAVTSQVAFHIVEMARSLRLDMIAEGVEQELQAQTLADWRVDCGQGWLFAKPLSPADFLAGLAAQRAAPVHVDDPAADVDVDA